MRKPSFNIFHFPVSGLQNPESCATSYVSVQTQPIVETQTEDGISISRAKEGETATAYSVYGRKSNGEWEWIADFGNELMSWMFTAQLSAVLGVPIEETPFNLQPLEAAVYMMNNQGEPN